VMGTYGLIDQLRAQDEQAPLPAPWRHLSEAVGAPKVVADVGVGFRLQKISD
jgi:hypothetical protein